MKLVTSKQIQEIDQISIQKFKIPSWTLMENAGRGVAETLRRRIGGPVGQILMVVGKGNNGGDGLVAARYLIEAGFDVLVAMTDDPGDLAPDSKVNWDKLNKLKTKVISLNTDVELKNFPAIIEKSKYVVDAIFGTGLNTEVRGKYRKIIDDINATSKTVISVDIPSGLSADTGQPMGVAVRSRMTITFGLPKLGHVLPPAPEYIRELYVVDIGFPKDLLESYKSNHHLITPDLFKEYFGPRKLNTNKGDYGHVLTLAGSTGKMGAGWLTSKAALRAGAGLVTYGMPETAFERFDTRFAEVMVEPVSDKKRGYFILDSVEDIRKICQKKDVVAIGPGIGTHKDTGQMISSIASRLNLPLVIDADGLNNLAGNLKILGKRRAETVLTPHPGEMSMLTGIDKKTILKDRMSVARDFAVSHGVYLVLKGHRTIVASPTGDIYINATGNPGMATAGTGDALTGIVAAFIAGKMPVLVAVIAAVYIHGLAGDLAASNIGEVGMITSDLIDNIPNAIKLVRQWEASGRVI